MWMFYYGLMGLIHGIFDIARLIDYSVHSSAGPFNSHAPRRYNMEQGVRLASGISLILGALAAYLTYKYGYPGSDDDVIVREDHRGRPDRPGGGYGAAGGGRPQQPRFQQFEGQGHRLGSDA